jgi:hypothetical protein
MTRTKRVLPPPGAPAHGSPARPAFKASICHDLAAPPRPLSLPMFLGRSLFPLLTLVIIVGTLAWGPWVTLALALVAWHFVGRLG